MRAVLIAATLAGTAGAPAVAQARDTLNRRPPPAPAARPQAAPAPRPQPAPAAALRPTPAPYPRPWIGLAFNCRDCRYMRDDSLRASRWSFPGPVEVYSVEEGSPAYTAGIRRGDVLTHVDGRAIATAEAGRRWASLQAGDTVRITYRRSSASVVTALYPAEPRSARGGTTPASAPAQATALRATVVRHDSVLSLARRHEQSLLRHQRAQEQLLLQLAERSATPAERRNLEVTLQAQHEEQLAQLRMYLQESQRLQSETRRALTALTPTPARAGATGESPARLQPQLRYSGTFAGAAVEVRGPSSVVVTEIDGELIITTQDTTVRLRIPARD